MGGRFSPEGEDIWVAILAGRVRIFAWLFAAPTYMAVGVECNKGRAVY